MAKQVTNLSDRITQATKEISKPNSRWMYIHYRAVMLLEEEIRRNAKKFMDDPTGYPLSFTSGQLKLLVAKMRTKLMKVTDVDAVLKEFSKHDIIDDDVFEKIFKPYLDLYYPMALKYQDILNRLSYTAIALDLYERQDHEACFLQSAILSAVKEA